MSGSPPPHIPPPSTLPKGCSTANHRPDGDCQNASRQTQQLECNHNHKRKRADHNDPEQTSSESTLTPVNLDPNDRGHRYGNFRNYYFFHPVENRTRILGGIIDYVCENFNRENEKLDSGVFYYTDIGCNQGDLTHEIARLLAQKLNDNETITTSKTKRRVQVTGMDLDPHLIQRAQSQHATAPESSNDFVQTTFEVRDVLREGLPNNSVQANLTTLFSTTMWIHIHGGDEGLQRVLEQVCRTTRHWILLEAQPSKCYRNAATRLRRMGLKAFDDVSSDRLKLRPNTEEAIENILHDNQFERIFLDDGEDEESETTTTTSWNRSLQLYERRSITAK